VAPIDKDRAAEIFELMFHGADDVFERASAHMQVGELVEAVDLLRGLCMKVADLRGDEPGENPFTSSLEPTWVKGLLMSAVVLVELARRRPDQEAQLLGSARNLWSEACKSPLWDDHSMDSMLTISEPGLREGAQEHKELVDGLWIVRKQLASFFSQFA
jgi:hypothetical protein